MRKYIAIYQEGDSMIFDSYNSMSVIGITSTFEDAVNKIKEKFLSFGYTEEDFEEYGAMQSLEMNNFWVDREGENDTYTILSGEED